MKKVTYAKKFILSALAGLGLATIVWNSSMALAAETSYSHKDVNELTEFEKAQLQKGAPTDIKEGEQIVFVYQAKGDGKCELAPQPSQPTLPFTGASNQTLITLGVAVPTLGAAVYLLSKNKKGRQTFMVVVLAGTAVLGTHVISANTVSSLQEQIQALVKQDATAIAAPQELECFEYVGYLRSGTTTEVPTTETTTTTTTTTPEEPTTVEEPTTTTTTEEEKTGTYKWTLEVTVPHALLTGDYTSLWSDAKKEKASQNGYTWSTTFNTNDINFKVLLDGKELQPYSESTFEGDHEGAIFHENIKLGTIVYHRYEYLVEESKGKVGEAISHKRIQYSFNGKVYDSIDDIVKALKDGMELDYENLLQGCIGGRTMRTISEEIIPQYQEFIEGHLEEHSVVNVLDWFGLACQL